MGLFTAVSCGPVSEASLQDRKEIPWLFAFFPIVVGEYQIPSSYSSKRKTFYPKTATGKTVGSTRCNPAVVAARQRPFRLLKPPNYRVTTLRL